MMDSMNWLVTTMLCDELIRERLNEASRLQLEHIAAEPGGGAKRAVASALVRLGLRLDPAAGEAPGAHPLQGAAAGRWR